MTGNAPAAFSLCGGGLPGLSGGAHRAYQLRPRHRAGLPQPLYRVNSGSGADLGFAVGIGLLCLAVGIYFCWQVRQQKRRGVETQNE